MDREVVVLRYSTRLFRDYRVNTHCGLVARAFGAGKIIYVKEDPELKKSLEEVTKNFGGPFDVLFREDWKNALKEYKNAGFYITHLTAFGIPFQKKIPETRKKEKILVLIGSEKVPGDFFELSDANVSVTQQPHSEVAALAVFLHELFEGRELEKKFSNARKEIEPMEKGRKTIRKVLN
jgi:tRNA (cytidine56-2'-O)-methyltransferase